jgi:hypothetical protein
MESNRCTPIVFGVKLDCYFHRLRAVLVDEPATTRTKLACV